MLTLRERLLIDGIGTAPRFDSVITIQYGIIIVVASRANGSLPYEDEEEVIDIPVVTIMLGLIHPHIYLSFSANEEALYDTPEDIYEMFPRWTTRNAQAAFASNTATLYDWGAQVILCSHCGMP